MNAAASPTRPDYSAHLKALREEMKRVGADAFLVPVTDEYQGEYPPACARRMTWLTGFTGSAGMAAVTADHAAAFVDGRYTVQVRQQVNMDEYEARDLISQPVESWLVEHLQKGATVAYDPWLHTQVEVARITAALQDAGLNFTPVGQNPVDAVWKDRPASPQEPVQVYSKALAGETSQSKRQRIAEQLKKYKAQSAVIAAPDSIAWLLNIRGGDVVHTPLALSYALLHADATVDWFIDDSKIRDEVRRHVGAEVRIVPMIEMAARLAEQGAAKARVLLDLKRAPSWFHFQLAESGATIVPGDDVCLLPKAIKNETEVAGIRHAHLRDGVALCRLLYWLDTETTQREVTELEVEKQLLAFRQEQDGFQEPSFETIAGSAGHGAIVHYRATEESNAVLQKDTLFLLDSGGQYLDGTTDVTRTIVVGQPTAEQVTRFTQVLKGHIALANARFPKGTNGAQLDVLARHALWAEGLDYAHGTGHGVGAYLGVHEGPQGISSRALTPLAAGMVLSNEPGFYKENEYGIRIENLVVVRTQAEVDGRTFLSFETLTLAPIDRRLIDLSLLSVEEVAWLDAYHQRVWETIGTELPEAERDWLKAKTAPLAQGHADAENAVKQRA